MGIFVDAGAGHRIACVEREGNSVRLLWEHDTRPGYAVPRHMVSSADGARWVLVPNQPLTLTPSLHCDPGRGGCGAHGHVIGGIWSGA